MPPQPVRDSTYRVVHTEQRSSSSHRVSSSGGGEQRSSSTMSSLMCCTSSRSAKAVSYKESQKKFLWLDPNRWSGQKSSKKEQVETIRPPPLSSRFPPLPP